MGYPSKKLGPDLTPFGTRKKFFPILIRLKGFIEVLIFYSPVPEFLVAMRRSQNLPNI
jgi:hypothetical protein